MNTQIKKLADLDTEINIGQNYASQDAICSQLANNAAETFCSKLGLESDVDLMRFSLASHAKIHPSAISDHIKSLSKLTTAETESRFAEMVGQKADAFDGPRAEFTKFSSTGGIVIGDTTAQMDALIQEDYDQQSFPTTVLDTLCPDSSTMAERVIMSYVAAPGGLIDPYTMGSPVAARKQLDYRTAEWRGGFYRNSIRFTEFDLLFRNNYGRLDARGIMTMIAYAMQKAKRHMYNRKQVIKATIFDGGSGQIFIGDGDGLPYTVDYQVPPWNKVSTIDAQPFGSIDPVTGLVTPNAAADIYTNFAYYLNSYKAWFTHHNPLNNGVFIMNPNTQLLITGNADIRALLGINQTRPGSAFSGFDQYTVNNVIHNILPGFNGKVIIDGSGYLAEDSSTSWDIVNGKFEFKTEAPEQNYFLPDGKILIASSSTAGPLAKFVNMPAAQKGGFTNPQTGEWLAYQEVSGPGFETGLTNPYSQIIYGFGGALQPYNQINTRIFDVLS